MIKQLDRPLRVFSYARFSAEMQSANSAVDQEREIRRFADQMGWVIVGAERDEAVRAGATAGRGGYERALEAARERLFDVLLVEELSRFSRDFVGGIAAIDEFRKLGVQLADTKNGIIDLVSPEGQLRVAFGLVSSQAETKRLGERSKRGLRGKVLGRFSAGGQPAYGFRREAVFSEVERDVDGRPKRVGVRLVPDENEAPIVCRIFREYDEGRAKHAIARGLNEDGVPSKRAGGLRLGRRNSGAFTPPGISGMLANPIYIGLRLWNRSSRSGEKLPTGKKRQHENPEATWDRVEGFVARVIEQDVWERVQQRLAEDRKRWSKEHTARKGTKYSLSGLLRCGGCGANYVIGAMRRGVRHYRCSFQTTRGDVICANRVTVAQPALEARVTGALDVLAKDPAALAELVARHNGRVDTANDHQVRVIDGLERRRAELLAERTRLVDAIAAGGAGLKVLVEGIAQREEQLASIDARIIESKGLLQPLLMPRPVSADDHVTGDASLFQGDAAKDKEFLARMVETIVVSADGNVVIRFRDEALFSRVAAYEFRAGSVPPTGSKADRRRGHIWDAGAFAVREGGAKASVREVPGGRPRFQRASPFRATTPPGSEPGAGGIENRMNVPSGTAVRFSAGKEAGQPTALLLCHASELDAAPKRRRRRKAPT